MSSNTIGAVICAVAIGACTSSVQAQTAPSANQTQSAAPASSIAAPADKKLTLSFRDASLKTVLEEISKKAGVVILLAAGPVYNHVNLDLNNKSVREVLHQVADASNTDLWEQSGNFYLGAKGSAPVQREPGQPGTNSGFSSRDLAKLEIALRQPVDIKLRDGTVKQAALVLAGISGVTIDVDKSVPTDLRLNVEAQSVSLGTVLEGMAQQANLMIAPTTGGVILKAWPSLNINGAHTSYKGKYAPWSDQWQRRPDIRQDWTTVWSVTGNRVDDSTGSFFTRGQRFGSQSGDFSLGFGGGNSYTRNTWVDQSQSIPGSASRAPGTDSGQSQSIPGGAAPGPSAAFGQSQSIPGAAASAPVTTLGQQSNRFSLSPAPSPAFGQSQSIQGIVPALPNGAYNLGSGTGVSAGMPGAYQIGGRFTVAVMGNLIVIAEPGSGAQGEQGVLLTVYRWNDQRQTLLKVSSVFHRGQVDTRRASVPDGGRNKVAPYREPVAPTGSLQGLPLGGRLGTDSAPTLSIPVAPGGAALPLRSDLPAPGAGSLPATTSPVNPGAAAAPPSAPVDPGGPGKSASVGADEPL